MTTQVPIVCHGCGQRGMATLDQVLKIGACSCGSDDLDVDDIEVTAAADRCVTCGVALPDKDRDRVGARIGNQCRACAKGEKKGSWESDIPMDTLRDTNVVSQLARCSNCFAEFQVSASDPAQPLPNCPSCGSTAVSAAGATNTYATAAAEASPMRCNECGHSFKKKIGPRTYEVKCPKCKGYDTEPKYASKTAGMYHIEHPKPDEWDVVSQWGSVIQRLPSEQDAHRAIQQMETGPWGGFGRLSGHVVEAGELSEGGIGTTLINAINAARQEKDKIPNWFKRFFGRMLLPEEIQSGYFIRSESGGSLENAFASRTALSDAWKQEMDTGDRSHPHGDPEGEHYWHTHIGGGRAHTHDEKPKVAAPDRDRIDELNEWRKVMYSQKQAGYRDLPEDHPGYICPKCDFHSRKVSEMDAHMKKHAAGPPKWHPDPSVGAGQGEAEEAPREREERRQRRIEQERAWDTEGDEKARKLIPSHFKSSLDTKIAQITRDILTANPGIDRRQAVALAEQVIQRYPKMVQRSA